MNRMNASDIIKARQNRNLFYAYYRPIVFSSGTVSTTNTYLISSSAGGGTSSTVCSTINYLYTCLPQFISYELENDVNNGKYLCGYPACSTITEWNTGVTHITGTCNCKISQLNWSANTSMGAMTTYASTGSTLSTSLNAYAVKPLVCTNPDFYQGTNFSSKCQVCSNLGNNATCYNCSSG
jgi:hypothetical protein